MKSHSTNLIYLIHIFHAQPTFLVFVPLREELVLIQKREGLLGQMWEIQFVIDVVVGVTEQLDCLQY